MSDHDDRSLTPLPDGSLTNMAAGAKRILAAMVGETLELTLARTGIQSAQRRIGAYAFCEPDYRQILAWSEALALEPEEKLRRLLDDYCRYVPPKRGPNEFPGNAPIGYRHFDFPPTTIVEGRIVMLTWNFELLPLREFVWVEGLEIEVMNIWPGSRDWWGRDTGISSFRPALPKLRCLCCDTVKIAELCLEGVPKLLELQLKNFDLAALSLESVPNLTKLDCSDNEIEKLDLSHVPTLRELCCKNNRLTELDVSRNPHIAELACGGNRLRKLDLSNVPHLTKLFCCGARNLRELDLSAVPELRELWCQYTAITELDLSRVPELEKLVCGILQGKIASLDVRSLRNLKYVSYEPDVTELLHRPDQSFLRME